MATQELQLTSLISLSEFMAEKLPVDEKREKINPVGVILYAKKSKMVMIGSGTDKDFKEALVCSYQVTPKGFNPDHVYDGRNRIIDLSDYEQLKVLQVSLGGVEIHTFRSIRILPSVNVTISTHNPVSRKEELVNVDEMELLKTFTGEAGGIVVFSGANLPEENGLVLKRDLDGSKTGLVLFMYPDTDPVNALDSVTGLHVFVKQLNQAFIDTPHYPLQAKSLLAFNQSLQTDEYDFGGIDVREELFKTLVIANARLAARLREPQYEEFLKLHLPNLGTPEWARLLRRLLMKIGIKDKSLQLVANRSINRLVLGEQITENKPLLVSTPGRKETDEDFLFNLKTRRARDIWHEVGNDYKDNWHNRLHSFTYQIVHFIEEAKKIDEIEDALVSLKRLENSSFQDREFFYSLDKNDEKEAESKIKWERTDYSVYRHKGRELIQYLKIAVLEKKKRMESQNF